MRTDYLRAAVVIAALLTPTMGCNGCLDLDEYRLVPRGYNTTTSSSGSGGGGGIGGGEPGVCDPVAGRGRMFVSMPVAPGDGAGGTLPCDASAAANGGIDVFLMEAQDGDCIARQRIDVTAGTVLDSALRIWSTDDLAYVVGTFSGGSLTFPQSCSGNNTVSIGEPAGATSTIFAAQLRFTGDSLCTQWAHTAFTSEAIPLRIESAQPHWDGTLMVAGSLAGASVDFGSSTVRGTAFWAAFDALGASEVEIFRGSPDDSILGMSSVSTNQFLLSGSLLHETPSCQGCVGSLSVTDAAGVCSMGSGGGGGAGGSGAAGGSGGAGTGATGGAGGGPADPDTHNAMLWHRTGVDSSCARFGTFGADTLGPGDAQLAYSASALLTSSSCYTYLGGGAGANAWRFVSSEPDSGIFNAGSSSADAFVARLDGSDTLDCGVGASHRWNVRLTPSMPGALAWSNRVRANRCNPGVNVAALVQGAPGGELALHRCEAGMTCMGNADSVSLSSADSQLVMLGFTPDGALDWSGALGPVAAGSRVLGGTSAGLSMDNFTLDLQDGLLIAFTSTGTLETDNVDLASCSELEFGAPAGTYVMALEFAGISGQARCSWVAQLR